MASRRGFGSIERLTSGRYRARYRPQGQDAYINAPTTFRTKAEADAWLSRERVRLEREAAGGPKPAVVEEKQSPTLDAYASRWLAVRDLRPSTARTYRNYLDRHVRPSLGRSVVSEITPEVIRAWHQTLAPDAPTVRARTYAWIKTVLASAVEEDLLPANPCRIRGASNVRPATEVITASREQVEALSAAMPPRYALSILIGAWCQLRAGETLALRRRDLDVERSVIDVRRGVTWQGRTPTFGPPKTAAGVRVVHMPSLMLPAAVDHLATHVGPDGEALIFPGEVREDWPIHLSTFSTQVFKRAVQATDLPETFRFHHLRHTGATMLAQQGATTAELQRRLGHATPGIAMRYQHSSDLRDREIAERLR